MKKEEEEGGWLLVNDVLGLLPRLRLLLLVVAPYTEEDSSSRGNDWLLVGAEES